MTTSWSPRLATSLSMMTAQMEPEGAGWEGGVAVVVDLWTIGKRGMALCIEGTQGGRTGHMGTTSGEGVVVVVTCEVPSRQQAGPGGGGLKRHPLGIVRDGAPANMTRMGSVRAPSRGKRGTGPARGGRSEIVGGRMLSWRPLRTRWTAVASGIRAHTARTSP